MAQKEYRGAGSIERLGPILTEIGPKRIFLVYGKTSFAASGALEKVLPALKNYNVLEYNNFGSNPQASDIEKGADLFRSFQPDAVLAVGGGSPMDVAKVAGLLALNNTTVEQWVAGAKPAVPKKIPVIAVPTTAGSGSEATQFGVFYDGKKKISLAEKAMIPAYVILDPELMMSLSKYQAAASGMDAFSQAVESYWSTFSSAESMDYAGQSMMLCVRHLVQSVNSPDIENRMAMAEAANLAGKAINITRTTACHAISYPFTSYFGVAHGHAVALTLSSMLRFIDGVREEDLLDLRGCEYVRGMTKNIASILGCNSVEDAAEQIGGIMRSIGLKSRLRDVGLADRKDIELIIKNGFDPERVRNIPRELKEQDLGDMLLALF